jgi:hypothetical protein
MAVISIKNKTKSGSLLVGNAPYQPGDYESIATTTVGAGGAASVTFSSIPSTYKHLQIRMIARDNRANPSDSGAFRFNSDSGTNYSYHALIGLGSSAIATGVDTYNRGLIDRFSAATATAGIFGAAIMDILDYANTSKYKTVRILGGYDLSSGTDHQAALSSGVWQSTSAISTILIYPNVGTSWDQYSEFALYGIKGA